MGNQEPEEMTSAPHALVGRTLKSGWKVLQRVNQKPSGTGGYFSVCYLAEKDGQIGFLKAFNIYCFMNEDSDLLGAIKAAIEAFEYERNLMEKCTNKHLDRVLRLLDSGREYIPGYFIPNVYYIISEKADADVRTYLNYSDNIDMAWKLRSLHNIATGLKQLHSIGIQHQDLKPSNIFVYSSNKTSKIGDLGRSLCRDVDSDYKQMLFSGATPYAPPEIFYRHLLENLEERFLANDMYLFGSLVVFYLTGQTMNALLSRNMNKDIEVYNLSYDDALPYWQMSFTTSLEEIRLQLQSANYADTDLLIQQIQYLCDPSPEHRGNPKNLREIGSNYNFDRFVSAFNLLASRAEYKVTH